MTGDQASSPNPEADPDHDLRITPCRNWNAVKKILGKGRKVALLASKTEIHVWPTDTLSPSDRCLCGARRW